MRYIEQVKSIVLLLLVLLSLVLTFLIWSYKPNFQLIEDPEVEQITIGNQKEIKDVLKPHRIIVRNQNSWIGTSDTKPVDLMMDTLSNWKGTELSLDAGNLTDVEMNELFSENEQMTLFFPEEIPVTVFSSILPFSQTELTEMTFNRLIIDFGNVQNHMMPIYFVSEQNRTRYQTNVSISEGQIQTDIKALFQGFIPYFEIKRNNSLSLFVPKERVELNKYTYTIDEISPDELKEALFIDPAIAQKTIENVDSINYTDGIYLMTVYQKSKMISYVYPKSESIAEIPASQLIKESFGFINEHGGLTDDFRLVSMNVPKHITEYQLFKQGYPVFSNTTRISTTWGEKEIFQYQRPYYKLNIGIPAEKSQLPSGVDIIDLINQSDLHLDAIKDIILGYYLTENDSNHLYTLEPSWFAIQRGGSWEPLTSEMLGGTENGLE